MHIHSIMLDWQQASILGAGLLVVRAATHRAPVSAVRRVGAYLGEAGIVGLLFAVWQYVGSLASTSPAGAVYRGHKILRIEHDVGLPCEHSVQGLINHHPSIEQAANMFYASVHFPSMGIFLLWLYARHRAAYSRVRVVIILLTLSCLAIQLIPVAPPRLLPGAGFVDTAAKFGQSVYYINGVAADAFSAMPSVHVGWSVLIAWAVVRYSPSRWRWLAVLHPVTTIFVVVSTANHYWLDGIVAVGLLTISIAITTVGASLFALLRAHLASGQRCEPSRPAPTGGRLVPAGPSQEQLSPTPAVSPGRDGSP